MNTTFTNLRQHFEIVRIIFFENDSTDDTLETLERLKASGPPIHVESEVNLTGSRTVILSHARNRLWELVGNMREPIDFVLSMDMDNVNRNLAHVQECLSLPSDWSVCCANTYAIYYDLWALRTLDDWVDLDVLKISLQRRRAKFRHIPASEPPIRVKSCFNGAALYKYPRLKPFNLTTYAGVDERGERICEHVVFHEKLLQQDSTLNLYIQPKMLNSGKPRGPKVWQRLRPEIDATLKNPDLKEWYKTNV